MRTAGRGEVLVKDEQNSNTVYFLEEIHVKITVLNVFHITVHFCKSVQCYKYVCGLIHIYLQYLSVIETELN